MFFSGVVTSCIVQNLLIFPQSSICKMCDWSENKGIAKVAAVCLLSARGNWKGNEATKATVREKSEAAEAPRDPGAIVGGVGRWMVDSG